MARNTTTKQPQPQHEPEAQPKTAVSSEAIVSEGAMQLRGKGGKSFVAAIQGDKGAQLAKKAQLLGTVSQRMAELQDVAAEYGEQAKEVESLEATVTDLLYQGRRDKLLTAEEVSAELGRYFGFVPKKDGTPGKTPAGRGAQIRRRLVRGIAAHEFVTDGDGGAFFDGVDPDWTVSDDDTRTVLDLVEAVDKGEMSLFTAHDLFQKIKSNNAQRTELAYDAKRINNLAQKLGQSVEASAQMFIDDPDLAIAYAALRDVFEIVDARAGELADA